VRTTVTLDDDTEALVRRLMAERGVSFKQALNDAIRAGAKPRPGPRSVTAVHHLGSAAVDLDKALRLAGELEDDELLRRLDRGQ
jgi:hypothetical protein